MYYTPSWESLKQHPLPKWFDDAKFGIFIHWGPYSVPHWANTEGKFGEIDRDMHFTLNPYSEWYQNTLRIAGSPTAEYHAKTYGEDFEYEQFADLWKAEKWDPEAWAALFEKAGAKYVVLTTMHHDGFNLWPSRYNQDYSVATKGPKRDLVGELTNAVRQRKLKMGHYYSGGLNWRFTFEPIVTFEDVKYVRPITYDFADYAYKQFAELIEKYQPDILWNDIGWPDKGLEDVKHLFAYYYNKVPEGVVNDRWHIEKNAPNWNHPPEEFETWEDFDTKEYSNDHQAAQKKWEYTRGMGYSFAFNSNEGEEETISEEELVSLLIEVVSKNGNLLLNVGPRPDGTIPEIQVERLHQLGAWLEMNGEGIYETRQSAQPSIKLDEETTVFFTQKEDVTFAFLTGKVTQQLTLELDELQAVHKVEALNPGDDIEAEIHGTTVTIRFKEQADTVAHGFKLIH
ncbi:TPA: alpha-L-fucosidase [Staphylococcus delphini]|nr:alpha-L-fucosidase [Staphylococcus delphini]HEC2167661.1 alpha-L-fucosidase [Staphylococcus delphini]HEC2170722.1 alpha-L-fucosidase [Staphylococcus delphini]HEC2177125.1 alpha-L-fucosidase [Staphylococcus delphini]HEC2180742.1 alpha-L-fucosidase [Staphylococcus delphini]